MTVIRNLTTSDIELSDLGGITVEALSDYDLKEESPTDIANSIELQNAINAGSIVYLDANGNPLTTEESLNVYKTASRHAIFIKKSGISITNTPHEVLNFISSGTTITDNNDGSVDIAIDSDSAIWGNISGTLSNQIDLQSALDNKSDIAHTHALNDISDVIITTPSVNQSVVFDGTNWINQQIDHNSLLNIGTNTHTQIDSHIANNNNPHGTNVSNLTDVSLTTLSTGNVLRYDGTNWINYPDSNYEPAFTKNTAFNKDFGTVAGTVAEGNHNHDGVYAPVVHTHVMADITDSTWISDITNESIKNLSDVSSSMVPSDGQVLTYNSTSGLWEAQNSSGSAPKVCCRHNGSSSQSLSSSFITINIGTDVTTDTSYYSVASNEITILQSGWYKVTYEVSFDSAGGMNGDKFQVLTQLELNGIKIAGSYIYTSGTNNYSQTSSATIWINVSANDVLRIRSQELSGNAVTEPEGCRITVEYYG